MSRLNEKKRLNDVFALVAKGLANANRLALLELLAQGERDVESLAKHSSLSVSNASHHLKLLRQCGLISRRREGQYAFYSLADDSVVTMIDILHRVAVDNLPELDRILADRFPPDEQVEEITPDDAEDLCAQEQCLILDMRPISEYSAGHVPGAVHMEKEALEDFPSADSNSQCIVYCRGRYCLIPLMAARVLGPKGYQVKRLAGGFPAWRVAGKQVESIKS
ncbi:ArsR family transcriptional regulator [Marinifilum sp. JC120]|nr:ArsR family transcriptional regulator [Marinifilum sp. JC120]